MARKKKRGHGEGTLEKRGNVWYVRYTDEGKRKRVNTGETDKAKAKSWMERFAAERSLTTKLEDEKTRLYHVKAKLESDITRDENALAAAAPVSVENMVSEIFDSATVGKHAPKDVTSATTYIQRRFVSEFSRWLRKKKPDVKTASEVTKEIAEEWLDEIQKETSTDKRVRGCGILRRAFGWLLEEGRVFKNPFEKIANPTKPAAVKKRPLTDEELEKLFKHLETKDSQTRALFVLCSETGQRFGDVCNFRWDYFSDVRVDDKLVKYLVYKPSKTRKFGTEVKLPLTKKAREMLDEIKAEKLDDVWVLPKWRKMYSGSRSVHATALANSIIKEAGINVLDERGRKVVGMHSLRHGFVSRLALSSANVPMTTIMSFVGHTREKMSEYYSHASVKSQVAAMEAFGETEGEKRVVEFSEGFWNEIQAKKRECETFEDCLKRLLSTAENVKGIREEKEAENRKIDEMLDEVLDGE